MCRIRKGDIVRILDRYHDDWIGRVDAINHEGCAGYIGIWWFHLDVDMAYFVVGARVLTLYDRTND